MTNTTPIIPGWLLDTALDALIPGVDMTLDAIYARFVHLRGHEGDSADDVRAALEYLNHLRADGREVEICDVSGIELRTYRRLITVGMGATVCGWSDRHAATVIGVSASGYKITVQRDKAVRTDANGMSEAQNYSYERDPNGAIQTFYRNSDGRYANRTKGGRLVLGQRNEYYDYGF